MTKKRKIAFICPRYGVKAAGGAEEYTQTLAGKLQAQGHKIEVFTTCAHDHFSWKNYYEEGRKRINNVLVRRFRVDGGRNTREFLSIQGQIDRRKKISLNLQERWISESVNSTNLYRFIEKQKGNFDCFAFIPYLFGVTYFGAKVAPEKSLLIPCLHNEPFAYLDIFRKLFSGVRGVIFHTYPEMELAKRIFNLPEDKMFRVGLGFEKNKDESNAQRFRKKYGIDDPFILFAGRREEGKNLPLLLNFFRDYKMHNQNNLKLVLIGSGEVCLGTRDKRDIIDLGYISSSDKQDAFAAALLFCQPSVNESFSIVLMESWLAARPTLVHGECEVTRDHCRRSNGGLWFSSYFEFEETVNFFLGNPRVADRIGRKGQAYVEEDYCWTRVLDRFEQALTKFGF